MVYTEIREFDKKANNLMGKFDRFLEDYFHKKLDEDDRLFIMDKLDNLLDEIFE